jgi:D-sedoheptulose 7-phosphate isomerase
MDPESPIEALAPMNGLQSGVPAYLDAVVDAIQRTSASSIDRAVMLLLETYAARRHIYIMGNGGSASTASHMACDLTRTARMAGTSPLFVLSLTDSTPLLTAFANDTTYESVFSGQLESLVGRGDLVIAISVSGSSPNVVAGLTTASKAGARTMGLFGLTGGVASQLVDVAIHVGSDDLGLVETVHLAVVHVLAWEVGNRMTDPDDRHLSVRRSPADPQSPRVG